ncbi:hypothetical protein GCM10028862_12720 [Luteimonas pelagia]
MTAQPVPRRRSLSPRIAATMLVASLLVSFVASALLLVDTYRDRIAVAQARVDEMGSGAVPSIAADLWQVDMGSVRMQLEGLTRISDVVYVRLDTREGERLEAGDPAAPALRVSTFPLRYEQGEVFELGLLSVVLGDERILAVVRRQALAIALVISSTLLVGALLLLRLLRVSVFRPLESLARQVRGAHIRDVHVPLALTRPSQVRGDELDEVVAALNAMRGMVVHELARRETVERALRRHQEELEVLVIERTRELEAQARELRRLANVDDLTGVATRRFFEEVAERELARGYRTGRPSSLVMLDIDHFKSVNDRHGHAAGDQALQALAMACRETLREEDLVGRMGGEEFAVLLPETAAERAVQIAERLRARVGALRVVLPGGEAIGFTISLGVAIADLARRESLDQLLARADEALYAAKHGGRDQVRVATAA